MELNHFLHRSDVVLRHRLRHAAATRIAISRERPHRSRHPRALLVRFAGHDRGDRAAKCPAFHAVVSVAVAHDERTEIRVAEPERAENVRILRDLLDRVARVIDQNFLRGDVDAAGRLKPLDIEHAVFAFELHQVQRGQIAGRVIEEEIFGAGVRGILPLGSLAGVPLVDRGIELHPRIAADVGPFRDLAEQGARLLLLARLPVAHLLRPPFAAFDGRVHEFVAHPHAQVFVLIHDRAVGVAVVTAVVALLDQRPGFLLFLLLRVDELLDVRMPVLERVHLRRAPGFAAALHHVRDLIVNFQERKRPARFPAAAQFFPRAPQRRKIASGAAAVLEEHRLARREAHDVFHRVLDALDEAGAALRIFVLRRRALGLAGGAIVEIIPRARRRGPTPY